MSSGRRSTCCASKRNAGLITLVGAALLGTIGCEMFAGGQRDDGPRLSPVLRRMRDTYPDLASGRFISLADFESPAEVQLFRVVGPAGNEGEYDQPSVSILRSRNETGAGSLKATLPDAAARLQFDGARSRELALVHDWSEYALLLMSLYAPNDGAELEFVVQSGTRTPLRWSRPLRLTAGWNEVAFDLATIGTRIDLRDVRMLAWQRRDGGAPLSFYVDDVIIADNTNVIIAAEEGRDAAGLYVYTRGRRIHVGCPERFELAWHAGVIASWQAGAPGPPGSAARAVPTSTFDELCAPGGLGPWPVWEDENRQVRNPWATVHDGTQRIVEVSRGRVVIEGARTAALGAAGTVREAAWQYVIHPSGSIYVRLRHDASKDDTSGVPMQAVRVDGRRGFEYAPPPPVAATGAPVTYGLLTQRGPEAADVLWTWPTDQAMKPLRAELSGDRRTLSILARCGPACADTAHLLRVWPTDIDASPEAVGIAADYQYPAHLDVEVGHVRTDVPGDRDGDGYNECGGCYELALTDGVLRCTFAPGRYLRFAPVLRVHESVGRRAWVYVRGRIIDGLAQDATGRLLVPLGPLLTSPARIEVHTLSAESAAPP